VKNPESPPRLALRLLERFGGGRGEDYGTAGDFVEYYRALAAERGIRAARRECRRQVRAAFPGYLKNSIAGSSAMLKHFFLIAIRNLRKHKGLSFINIAGLAVGLACSILIFLWVRDERSIDGFHANGKAIYRLIQEVKYSGREMSVAVTQGALGPSLQRDVPEIVGSCRLARAEMKFAAGERWFTESVRLADASFFEMFTFPLRQGDPTSALVDPYSIVLSEETARKYFPDGDAFGKTLHADKNVDFRVTGVMKTPPRNSILRADAFLPFVFGRELGLPVDAWDDSRFTTFVQLEKDARLASVAAKISGYLKGKPIVEKDAALSLQPLRDIYLHPGLAGEQFVLGDIRAVRIFSLAALFILLIACANFMNLATASSAHRAREVGLRKVCGAGRGRLMGQFYAESFVLTALSLGAAIVLAGILLPPFNKIAAKELSFGLFAVPGNFLALAELLLLTAFLAGSYPALFLSRFQPSRVLKGDLSLGTRGRILRRILFVSQFSLAVLLLICTICVRNQVVFMRNFQTGWDKEQIVTTVMGEEMRGRFEAVREELLRNPDILGVAAASSLPTRGYLYTNALWDWPGKNPREEIVMRGTCADVGYFPLLGMEIIRGRDFVEAEEANTNIQWIINEEAARIMDFSDPVGQPLTQAGEFKGTIVGVVKDYHFTGLKERIDPLVVGYSPYLSQILFTKIRPGKAPGAIKALESAWKKFAPRDEFKYSFLTEAADALYRSEERIEGVLVAFSILSVIVACLGLFGLAAFLAEKRTKEIGIRKALGASTAKIVFLFSREFIWDVAAANAVAWPAAYFFAREWLRDYAYRITLGPGPFLLAAALTLSIALATAGHRFIRAAGIPPAKTLKYE